MANYRNNTVDELKVLLDSTRATVRTEYLKHTAGLSFDIANATTHMMAVANITSALISKQHTLSREELDDNQGLARMICEMRGINSFAPQSNSTSLGPHVGSATFSSPQVAKEKIPVFSGQFRDYASFKLIFDQLVHDSPFYDEDAKVRQLLRHLSGSAAEIVAPFIGQADAYQSMREALITEYEKGHHFKDHLKSEVEKLPRLMDRYDEKLVEFRNTLNRIWSATKAGTAVGDDFFHVLYNLVISRFSDKLKEGLVRKCPDIGAVVKLLDQWKEQRERLINTGCLRSQRAEAPARNERMGKYRSAVAHEQSPRANCVFCHGEHEASQCRVLLDPRKRKDIAAQCRLCFVCLQGGHRASDSECPLSGTRCNQCQRGSHHISLCLGQLQSHRAAAASFQPGRRTVTPPCSPIVQFPSSPPRSYPTAPMIGYSQSPIPSPSFVPSTYPVPTFVPSFMPPPVPFPVPSSVPSFVPSSVPSSVPSFAPPFVPTSAPYYVSSSVFQNNSRVPSPAPPAMPSETSSPCAQPVPPQPKPTFRSGAARVLSQRLESLGSVGTAILCREENNESMLYAELQGKRIKLLLDSGSERTIIARHLVKPGDAFPGPPAMLDGIGGVETTTEMSRIFLTGDEVPPICLYGHVLSRLPDVDVIVGRHDIPLLLRQEVLDHGRCYFDTVVGRVYISDPDEHTRVAATRVRCLRVALANEAVPEVEPLMRELTEDDTEPEMPLELTRASDGRFVARLPFLPGPTPANNFFSAKHRHDRLQTRLERLNMTEEYESNLMEYVKNGHAVPVEEEVPWTGEAFYLPHREVIKEESSTTRFRIVFDASANSPSLNERLFKGNAEQLNLVANLMGFRKHPVAVIADISKAFLQIEIVPEHRKYLRFLWKTKEGLKIFEMCRLPFGLVSSPAILMTAIQQLIEEHETSHPVSASLLKQAFYMDDLVLSVPTVEEADQLRTEAMEIFASAGFTLAKWDTNVPELQSKWNGQLSAGSAKVLGTMWNQADDVLSVRSPAVPELEVITPREMMKFIGSVFDVLGLLEPVKLSLKKLARAAIVQKVPWDDPVPGELANEFCNLLKRFNDLGQIQVPRHVPPPSSVSFFSDASEDGLGYAVYFTDACQKNYFIYGKSRLAPLKQRTMPELELAALTEAVEQLPFLCRMFDLSGVPFFFWSDSSITLHRLESNLNRHGSYVANRLVRIHRVCEKHPSNFRYVPTKVNPADVYSRPKTVRQLLKEAPSNFAENLEKLVERTENLQLPKVFLSCAVKSTSAPLIDLVGFERIGEWSKLVRVGKRVLQFRYATGKRPELPTTQDALVHLFRGIQQQCLDELTQVKLPTEKDEQGVIRVRTRVADYRPIWLPKSTRIAEMVVRHAHAKTGHHMRRRFTKALVNERYYIPRVNQIIDRVLKFCVPCQKARRQHVSQPVGDLPEFRTREFLPFECVGIDYLGPMQINDGSKRWVLLVTCSVSRAIHLEVVSDLSSAACLAALNCVFNYRGYPRVIFSDNGTNFTAAEQDLKRLRLATQKAKDQVYEFGIDWRFNPPRASWWGGMFERMVGVVKNGLRKVAGPKTDTQLRYLLAELMAVVNSRPLFSGDSERDPVITPGHYLIGRSYRSVPQGPGVLNSFRALNQIKKWRMRFIRYWRSEYLRQLGLHYKQIQKTEIHPGDLVLMIDDTEEIWKLARIEAVDRGPDGIVRQVSLLLPDPKAIDLKRRGKQSRPRPRRILKRAVQSLVRLELDADRRAGECQGSFLGVPESSAASRNDPAESAAHGRALPPHCLNPLETDDAAEACAASGETST